MSTYEPIDHQVLASNTSTVTFSSIPQTYTDLVIIAYGSTAGTAGSVCLRVGNNTVDTNSNYSATWGYGTSQRTPSVAPVHTSSRSNGTNLWGLAGWSVALASTATFSAEMHIFNYSSTTNYKAAIGHEVSFDTTTAGFIENYSASWKNNSAINIITIFNNGGGTLAAGSAFSLYGIKVA